jgi:hypothetical protein
MPVPSTLFDLSATAASNSPAGTDSIGTSLDDYLRAIQAIIKGEAASQADIASGATITPLATGSTFNVTGTTGISAIASTNSWDGRIIVVRFAGALVLTHASSLALPGAADVTTVAGDVAIFRQESSGNWRCLIYHRNAVPSIDTDFSASISDGSGQGLTFSTVAAKSTRIGSRVFFTLVLTYPPTLSALPVQVNGLPYSVNGEVSLSCASNRAGGVEALAGAVAAGAISFYAPGTLTALTNTQMQNVKVYVSGHYAI